MNEDTIEFFLHAHRKNTHKAYNFGWKKWTDWCKTQQPPITPTDYDEHKVLRFLMDNRHLSTQHLNGIRSAIASVFKIVHPDKTPIALQEIIVEFFAAKRRSDIRIPSKAQLTTWGSGIMVQYIKQQWPKNQDLTLSDLQLKTVLLLCLFSSARPRSEVGDLQFRDVHFEFVNNEVSEMVIFFREPKETQVKPYQLGLINDREVCPVRTLYDFHTRTRQLRNHFPEDHSLFLAFIEQTTKTRPASTSTVAS